MCLLGVVLTPMMRALEGLGILPRTLADDLTIEASMERHWMRIIEAGSFAHLYLKTMGAEVNKKKCFVMSTAPHPC